MSIEPAIPLSRRTLLQGAAAAVPSLPRASGLRDSTAQENGVTPAAPQQFSFDLLTEQMRALATEPFARCRPEGFLGDLTYDTYRLIRFREDAARWQDGPSDWRLRAFHMGWLFPNLSASTR